MTGTVERFPVPDDGALSTEMKGAYARDGFLVLQGFVEPADCNALIARADQLLETFDPTDNATIFETHTQSQGAERYFLDSGDKIRFFFEAEAFGETGQLRQEKALSINKIGHALHDLDPAFDRFSRDPRLARLASELGISEPRLLQSMYIFKQPMIGGEVTCHQDATFLYTDPITAAGFWFALEPATVANGCLWALPGGHAQGLKSRFRRSGKGCEMQVIDPTPWPEDNLLPLEAEVGDLILLHGLLPHLSYANRTERSRHADSLHLIDATAEYPDDNWLRRGPEMPLKGF